MYPINKKVKAIFVDVDGTLADTMTAHNKAYELAFALNNVPFDMSEHEFWAPFGGELLIQKTVIDTGYGSKVESIISDKQKLLPFCLDKFMKPNVNLVRFLRVVSEDIPVIIVSNGRKKSVDQVLNRLGLRYCIGGILTKEDFKKSKPYPEPYLKALELMEVNPDEVVVFEDNEVGYSSARAAGITDVRMVNTSEF